MASSAEVCLWGSPLGVVCDAAMFVTSTGSTVGVAWDDTTTPYEVLGLRRSASQDEVRAAYRRLARLRHPDHGGDTEAFQMLQAAYELLSDPIARSDWDESDATTRPNETRSTRWEPAGDGSEVPRNPSSSVRMETRSGSVMRIPKLIGLCFVLMFATQVMVSTALPWLGPASSVPAYGAVGIVVWLHVKRRRSQRT